MSKSKNSLLILFSVVVLDLIGFGIVIPILPFYAEQYGANATILGLLLTSFAAMQFIFSPLWGKLSDKIGRKKVLLLTMTGAVFGLLVLGLAHSLWMLFAGRIISGIFAANISVASAYVSDVTTEENRAKGMGLIGAAFGIGFILGPALGGILSIYGYAVPILVAAGLSALNVIYAFARLGEPLRPQTAGEAPLSRSAVLNDPYVRKMCLLNLLFTLGVTQLEAVFAFFMMDRFGYDARHVAYILVMMALIMVAIQGGMIKHLVVKFGEKNLMLSGSLLLGACFFFVPSSHLIAILLIPLAISSIGRGISQPSMMSLVSKGAPDNLRGAVMGSFQASASLARVIGPSIAGMLYDRAHTLPFYLASILMGLVFIFGFGLKTENAKSQISEFVAEVDLPAS
jgi:MFS family permease